MSLERIKGEIVFVCDDCEDHIDTHTTAFGEAVQQLRDLRWQFYKDGDTWIHKCPDCRD